MLLDIFRNDIIETATSLIWENEALNFFFNIHRKELISVDLEERERERERQLEISKPFKLHRIVDYWIKGSRTIFSAVR